MDLNPSMLRGTPSLLSAACFLCGKPVDILDAHFIMGSGRVCPGCWPNYKAEHFTEAECRRCHQPFDREIDREIDRDEAYCGECRKLRHVCPRCKGERFSEASYEDVCPKCRGAAAAKKFWSEVPPTYRTSEAERLPCRQESDLVLDWKPSGQCFGLFLWGDTGGGKTRTLYLLARLAASRLEAVAVVRGQEFGQQVVELSWADSPLALGKFLDRLRSVDLLCIDEADKVRLSPRVESELFDIFEQRLAAGRATVLTSNLDLEAFSARFSDAYRDAVRRRLMEFFRPVKFSL